MPELDLDQEIESLTEMIHACGVDAQEAKATVKADEEKIKKHILEELRSFKHVNQTVEQALWIEMIKTFRDRKAKESFAQSSLVLEPSSAILEQQQHGCMLS